jgi:hypothetical protein
VTGNTRKAMVEYREKRLWSVIIVLASFRLFLLALAFLVDTSTKPQEMSLSLDLESSINAS